MAQIYFSKINEAAWRAQVKKKQNPFCASLFKKLDDSKQFYIRPTDLPEKPVSSVNLWLISATVVIIFPARIILFQIWSSIKILY